MELSETKGDLWFGAFVWNEPYVQTITTELKRRGFLGRIGVAGPQVSYSSSNLEQYYPAADMFIRGYAESAVAAVALGDEDAQGFHLKGQPDRALHGAVSLDKMPSPHLLGILPPQPFVRWETRRGCPFQCSFCQHREPNTTMTSKKFHEERIRNEINHFATSGVESIAVLDPTFNTDTFWATSILDQFGMSPFSGKLALQIRPEKINKTFLSAVQTLRKTHVDVELEIGVQTFDPAALASIDRVKGSDVNKVIHRVQQKLKRVEAFEISASVSLIFGLPFQTIESFQRDIEWCKSNVPSIHVEAFPLMLLRGTPLYDKKHTLQLVEATNVPHPILQDRIQDFIPHVISSPWFTEDDWHRMATMAHLLSL
jgi:radical SAM superfamily enzyme YgiQ (UPF0313 family)